MTRKAARRLIGLAILGLVLVAFGTWRAWQPGADDTSRETQAQRPALELVAPAFAAPPAGPAADAGFDRTIGVGDNILLDGGGSTAPKRKELSFSWTLALIPVGSAAALSGAGVRRPWSKRLTPVLFPATRCRPSSTILL